MTLYYESTEDSAGCIITVEVIAAQRRLLFLVCLRSAALVAMAPFAAPEFTPRSQKPAQRIALSL